MQAMVTQSKFSSGWKRPATIVLGGVVLTAIGYFNPFVPDRGHKVLGAEIAVLITIAALLSWSWRTLRRRGGRSHHVLAAVVVLVVGGLVGTLRLRYLGDLAVWPKPRPWVLAALRKAGVKFKDDVLHRSRLADPPLVLTTTDDDVTRFLGPQGDNHFRFAPGRPSRDWSKSPPRELWRVQVGPGWSSFAVVGKYGFTQQQTSDLAFEQVTCYDLTDGSLKWVHGDGVVFSSSMGGDGPRATPTYFNGKLVTVGAQGLLNCFDAATGKLLWSRDAVAENDSAPPLWGLSSSAFAFHSDKHGDLVVMSSGGVGGKSLHAYRLDDGKEIWSVGDDAAGYATPDLKTIGGVPQIVVLQWQAVSGHDPDTGAELWRYNDPHDWENINPKVPQPIVLDDRRVLVSAGYGTGCVLLELTKQADGKFAVEKKWRSTKLKPKFTNLVVRDGFVYGLDDGAFLVCLDLADGDLKWRSKRGANYGHGQILLIDDLLIVQSEAGDVALVAADPKKYEELGRITALPTGVSWNQPVVTGRKLLVRNDKEAACYELPTEGAGAGR